MTLLAIESSCDDTAAAVIHNGKMRSNVVASQEIHEQYGGVVPELASRAHQQHIVPVVDAALKQAGITKQQLSGIAFTQGPGLLGSLMVGASFAKSMALGLNIPLIAVNHLDAHVLAHFIGNNEPGFPFLSLLVSGGHTQIVKVNSPSDFEILGKTRDDAAGEAFDKTAKMLGLPYPGGPVLDKLASTGDPHKFQFPDSRVGELDFSFSGLKTAVLYFIRDQRSSNPEFVEQNLNDICASIQHTIVSYLMRKLKKAVDQTGIQEIALAGGVSANSYLRMRFQELAHARGWKVFVPALEYCTDNAAMIAQTAYFRFKEQQFADQDIVPYARMEK
ncbi:MAG: tRNA (adenosine(37)-N6)-threonylcarbamoyltransferase complex transferase subunit TsaD [Bacteroidia bacterium]|nr:tRNA (adenosine(37)-N6)-threonylcarbamoyltransferase complex transferase subunit TsaD [Bacteroidia bacterium]